MTDNVAEPSVLVVEDNDSLRTEIAGLFRDDGYRVVEAADGARALDILKGGAAIDVVLLDLWMPTIDGWRFRVEQRRDPLVRDVPVVVLTADDSAQARAIDADAFVRKPFDVDTLSETVRDVISKHHGDTVSNDFVRETMALVAGAIGHELANPLTILIHGLEHAQRTGDPGQKGRSRADVGEMLDQCWRIVETIRSLRDLPSPRPKATRAVDLARAMETAMGATVREGAGLLLAPGTPKVAGDAQVVHYICRALLRNAVEATTNGDLSPGTPGMHKIEVSVRVEGPTVVLDVHDNGTQIAPADQARVFSPEYLGRGRGWSAGLRLWFVRQAVEAMGGSVEVENDAERGVHSRVRLPIAASTGD